MIEPPAGATYDAGKADKAVAFLTNLKQIQGRWAGNNLELLPWQDDLVRQLFGLVRPDGRRWYRTCYVEIPRKNGKSTLAAGIALYLTCADGEQGAQVYSAAADREQANIVFDTATEIVRRTPALAARVRVFASYNIKRLVYEPSGSFYRSIPADAAGAHGFNAHGVILDEAHTQPNRDLFDVLTTSVGARTQPLIFVITTAGFDRHSLCWELHEYARQVRDGVIDDPTFLPVLYAADEGDDWTDPAVWEKANPSLGHTIGREFLAEECTRAQNAPAYQNSFRRLYLNQWTAQETRWLDLAAWDRGGAPLDDGDLLGKDCHVGLDLASTTDLTAAVAVFRDGDDYRALAHFWMPADTMRERERRDRVPYAQWAAAGLIEATPGNVVDYAAVEARLGEWAHRYRICSVAFDPWNATQLTLRLADGGLNCIPVRQGFASLSAPTKELMNLILAGRLHHGGNPVLRWMADNVTVVTDPAGNIKPDKGKSTQRIDGIVALIMALSQATIAGPATHYYETAELLVLGGEGAE